MAERSALAAPPDRPRPSSAPAGIGRPGPGAADRLDHACARIAGRLADALEAVGGESEERLAFLRRIAAEVPSGAGWDGSCLGLPLGASTAPVDRLVVTLAPTSAELDLVVLAGAAHLHEGIAAILRHLHPEGRPWPTVGLAALLAEHGLLGSSGSPDGSGSSRPTGVASRAAVRTLLTAGILARTRALVVEGDGPLTERTLRLAPGLWEALLGQPGWPAGVDESDPPHPPWALERWFDDAMVRAAGAAVQAGAPVVVVATADRPQAAATRMAALVAAAERQPVTLHVPALDGRVVESVAMLAVVRGVVPVIWSDIAPGGPITGGAVPGPVVLTLPRESHVDAWPRPVIEVPIEPLGRAERIRATLAALPELGTIDHPVGPAVLEPGELAVAAADLRAAAGLASSPIDVGTLRTAIDARSIHAVPSGTALVHPGAGWDDLVLPEARVDQLREAVARVGASRIVLDDWGFLRDRPGRGGLRLLFCGPPGTGKTLAAEVVAAELGRDLLVVDLSRMVSKWIGETEKNLAATFDAAERGGAVLLIDEADALFGRRTEVGDARDRYANLETAYLLSRVERFDGVVVLSTNLRQNLDAAFARRLEFIVPFDLPDASDRERLWRRHLPPAAPLAASLDVSRLAALYELPGALIRNAAVAAAFLAATGPEGPGTITLRHLVLAVRREYVKAGQAFPGVPAGVEL